MISLDYSVNVLTEYTAEGIVRHKCATREQMEQLGDKILERQARVYGTINKEESECPTLCLNT